MSAISRIAIAAAAGLVWSVSSVSAADLGGNCCADLEERIAELEATTARKGNRKMSLTVSGQVTRSIMYWRDATGSDTYAGLDNHNQSTRFIFSGNAKIRPDLTAGFEFMTEWAGGARTSTVTQLDEDAAVSGQANVSPIGDGVLAVRTANWWLEDARLGKVTVGRINVGGPVATIDLGGISTAAHFAPTLNGGGFFAANNAGILPLLPYSQLVGPVYGGNRMEGIRYDSPNLMGFLVQATWGEDDQYSASIRYAGDFSGFRVAAGIGFERIKEFSQPGALPALAQTFTDDKLWSGSLALMHTATGLFVQGHYGKSIFEVASAAFGGAAVDKPDASIFMIQAGISRNWLGLGNTSIFGEYARAKNYGDNFLLTTCTSTACDPFWVTGDVVARTEVKIMGAGVVQQLDAAAMEVYLNWRRFSPEISVDLLAGGTADADVKPIDMVTGGARIRF